MQTFKEVLSRPEERQNLKNMGICVLLILVLALVSFGAVYVRFSSHRRPVVLPGELASGEPLAYP